MHSRIVCIGGIHGAGKSTVCRRITERLGWPAIKQRRIILQLAHEDGVPWSVVEERYDEYLERVSVRILDMVRSSGVLLVDCHYAIPSAAAARPVEQAEGFVPNLEWFVVQRLVAEVDCGFVLLEVDPEVALSRIRHRPEAEHYENTPEHFHKEALAERALYEALLGRFRIMPDNQLRLSHGSIEEAVDRVIAFATGNQVGVSEGHP